MLFQLAHCVPNRVGVLSIGRTRVGLVGHEEGLPQSKNKYAKGKAGAEQGMTHTERTLWEGTGRPGGNAVIHADPRKGRGRGKLLRAPDFGRPAESPLTCGDGRPLGWSGDTSLGKGRHSSPGYNAGIK